MVSDPTLVQVLVRFLSGSSTNGTSQHSAHVGPTATQAMHEFLSRLQVHLSSTCPQMFSEFLLKLVHILTTERFVRKVQNRHSCHAAHCVIPYLFPSDHAGVRSSRATVLWTLKSSC